MFSEQIINACARFPANNEERFLIYPALAVYSPMEDLVKTVVGVIFTALSLASLGLCAPINNVANWTRHSRGIFTVPAQIIGNIFEIHSKILMNYNIIAPVSCALGNIAISVATSVVQNNPEDDIEELLNKARAEIDEKKFNYSDDILLKKAQRVCTNLFQIRTESSIQLLAKHIIFRIYSVINAIACTCLLGIIAPLASIVFIHVATYHRGREEKENDIALMILKIPQLIYSVCLTLRMIVNPLQFTEKSSKELELDPNPIMNALRAPGDFWNNILELRRS